MQIIRRVKARPNRFIYNLYNIVSTVLIFNLFFLFNYLFINNIRYLFCI